MSTKQANTEDLGWQSIDALIGELVPVIMEHTKRVSVYDTRKYIEAQLETVYDNATLRNLKEAEDEIRDREGDGPEDN